MMVKHENESRLPPLRLQCCAFLCKPQCCQGNGETDAVSTVRNKALSSKRSRLALSEQLKAVKYPLHCKKTLWPHQSRVQVQTNTYMLQTTGKPMLPTRVALLSDCSGIAELPLPSQRLVIFFGFGFF